MVNTIKADIADTIEGRAEGLLDDEGVDRDVCISIADDILNPESPLGKLLLGCLHAFNQQPRFFFDDPNFKSSYELAAQLDILFSKEESRGSK